ncbi:MAG: sigma-70 family RNA polymerase sigma factor [Pseudomonadota bacterium]
MEDRPENSSFVSASEPDTDVRGEEGSARSTDSKLKGIWADLYAKYFERLSRGLFATYGAGPPDPEDIAQRTFLKLNELKSADGIRDLEAFAWIVARNFMISEKRSLKMRADHTFAERALVAQECDTIDPERVLMGKEQIDVVMRVLDEMPDRRKHIFLACRVEGLTPKAAGARCGVSRSSAVRHLALATQAISEACKEAGQVKSEEDFS